MKPCLEASGYIMLPGLGRSGRERVLDAQRQFALAWNSRACLLRDLEAVERREAALRVLVKEAELEVERTRERMKAEQGVWGNRGGAR